MAEEIILFICCQQPCELLIWPFLQLLNQYVYPRVKDVARVKKTYEILMSYFFGLFLQLLMQYVYPRARAVARILKDPRHLNKLLSGFFLQLLMQYIYLRVTGIARIKKDLRQPNKLLFWLFVCSSSCKYLPKGQGCYEDPKRPKGILMNYFFVVYFTQGSGGVARS